MSYVLICQLTCWFSVALEVSAHEDFKLVLLPLFIQCRNPKTSHLPPLLTFPDCDVSVMCFSSMFILTLQDSSVVLYTQYLFRYTHLFTLSDTLYSFLHFCPSARGHSPSTWKTFFNVSFSTSLLETNLFSFSSSGNVLLLPVFEFWRISLLGTEFYSNFFLLV